MIIYIHVLGALASIGLSGLSWFKPGHRVSTATYLATVATLASGTYLVISRHQPMLSACVSGLVFVGVVLTGVKLGQRRLAKALVRDQL